MSAEAAILKIIFPPAGSVPLGCIDNIDKIRSHIRQAIALSGGDGASTPARVSNPISSEALTQRVVALRESPEGMVLSWREIGAKLSITGDAASKRYQNFRKRREAEALRKEGYAALSGDATLRNVAVGPRIDGREHFVEANEMLAAAQDGKKQEIEQVPGRAELREPKPTDEEKATIRESRIVQEKEEVPGRVAAPGASALPTETAADQDVKHVEEFADSIKESVKKLWSDGKDVKEIAEELGVRWQWVRGVCAHLPERAPPAETSAEDSKPEPKAIGRAELDAKIWEMHKAGKSVEEISNELYAEGLYYTEKSVRVRLISQGAEL